MGFLKKVCSYVATLLLVISYSVVLFSIALLYPRLALDCILQGTQGVIDAHKEVQ